MKIQTLFAKSLLSAAMVGALSVSGAAFAQKAPAAQAQTQNPFVQMKEILKITSAQEGAWNSYVSVYNQNFNPSRQPSPQEFNAMRTPQRIEFLKNLRNEETNFANKRFDATVAMYNQLDDNQKKMFDQMSSVAEPQAKAKAPAKKK